MGGLKNLRDRRRGRHESGSIFLDSLIAVFIISVSLFAVARTVAFLSRRASEYHTQIIQAIESENENIGKIH